MHERCGRQDSIKGARHYVHHVELTSWDAALQNTEENKEIVSCVSLGT